MICIAKTFAFWINYFTLGMLHLCWASREKKSSDYIAVNQVINLQRGLFFLKKNIHIVHRLYIVLSSCCEDSGVCSKLFSSCDTTAVHMAWKCLRTHQLFRAASCPLWGNNNEQTVFWVAYLLLFSWNSPWYTSWGTSEFLGTLIKTMEIKHLDPIWHDSECLKSSLA